MDELISIIVPVYNVKKYLNKCLDSILYQTYQNFELLLIDDGSTDGSSEICDLYLKKDSRINVIHKKNEGVSVARNIGIQVAKGKYIQFVDSDDFLDENMTDYLMKEIDTNNSLTICNIELYYKDKKNCRNLITISDEKKRYTIKEYLTIFVLKYKISPFIGSPCNKIFKKDILLNNKIKFKENQIFAEDFMFNIEYLYHVSDITVIKEPLYFYRIDTENSLTKDLKPAKYWWNNYKNLYIKYKNIFYFYDLMEDNNLKILLFVEFAVRDCIRKSFRSKYKVSFHNKIQSIIDICEDSLTQETMSLFECKDIYMKVIRFFSKYKLYNILGFLLILHSYLVNLYKCLLKILNNYSCNRFKR
jgi:glycosyltransferase involved in cell wall biosynthesis